jgi:exonuclease III
MKFLSWNCQGLGNPKTVRILKKLLTSHAPDLAFLMETKLSNSTFSFIKNVSDSYSVNSFNCSTSGGGKAGGIALIWNHSNISIDILNYDFNYFDVLISTASDPNKWRATGIYGYPQQHNKHLTCRLINDLSELHNYPQWLIFGDFNLMINNDEKLGGNLLEPNITNSFRNTLSLCDLQDLGYSGSKYT